MKELKGLKEDIKELKMLIQKKKNEVIFLFNKYSIVKIIE